MSRHLLLITLYTIPLSLLWLGLSMPGQALAPVVDTLFPGQIDDSPFRMLIHFTPLCVCWLGIFLHSPRWPEPGHQS